MIARWFMVSMLLLVVASFAASACSDNNNSAPGTPAQTQVLSGAGGSAGRGLQQQGGSVADVVEKAGPSVVRVGVNCQGGDPNRCAGTGSGWLFDNDGHFVTNNHVVTLDEQLSQPANIIVSTQAGGQFDATVVGRDPQTDLAVIKGDAQGMQALSLASSESHRIGDQVVAIGYALDLGTSPSVTTGIISAMQRAIQETTTNLFGLVQTDAAINPGNSGGPLLDLSGNVVGVNTAVAQSAQGIGFAIGSESVDAVVKEIIDNGKVDRGFLGIGFQEVTPGLAEELKLPVKQGIRVEEVVPGSPAEQAGLKEGDVITRLADRDIRFASDLTIALVEHGPGDEVEVQYFRGNQPSTVKVKLGEPPARP